MEFSKKYSDPNLDIPKCLVIEMGIDQIGKNFVKSMSVKKFSYLGQFIQGLRTPAIVVRVKSLFKMSSKLSNRLLTRGSQPHMNCPK